MTDSSITAEKLLHVHAVQLRPQQPFTWASGWRSPIYCDNRKILSYPFIRDYIKSELCNVVFEKFADADLVAGVATAGVPWGILIADQLKLPFIYVRPNAKQHGLSNQIEGHFNAGQKTVIIEDLVSTGNSSLQVANVIKEKNLLVLGLVSIFNYRFDVATKAFESAQIPVYSLTDYPAMIELAIRTGIVKSSDEDVLLKWRTDPANWKAVS
jgi:orotate phosphoribosyltransferase